PVAGVEAIANGVNAFRKPHGKNAAATLGILGVISIAMFVGVSWLAVHMHARPTATGTPSVLSELARGVFPAGHWSAFMYWVVQILTLLILVLAANTSFQGFPRLAALLARDRYFARQFTNLGDRLVFSNGIVVLAGAASLLLWIYHAQVDSLIHLYVVGVFPALRSRRPGWCATGYARTTSAGAARLSSTGSARPRPAWSPWSWCGRSSPKAPGWSRLRSRRSSSSSAASTVITAASVAASGPASARRARPASRRTRRCSGSTRSTSPPRAGSGT